MNQTDFSESKSGQLVNHLGYLAFVPDPLPPAIQFDAGLVMALSKADAALSELSGLGGQLPNPHLLIAPYMRREAVLSSRIEGTQASLSDLLIDEIEEGQSRRRTPSDDIKEIRNYVRALEHGIARLPDLPLSLRLVREIHSELMHGVRGEKATPGEFRAKQNWIGPAPSPATAAFVPPPVNEMTGCLDEWERFLHVRDTLPDLIQCALMHVQFETIHPFLDGNGRVGRLLVTFFLIERARLSRPLLYLSAFIEAHKGDYYDLLQRVRTHGDWTSWILFFLRGVTETATAAGHQARELHQLREQYRAQLKKKANALLLIDELFNNPYMTIARAARVLGKTHPTAATAISELEKSGILNEATGRLWGRVYVCRPVLDALERPIA